MRKLPYAVVTTGFVLLFISLIGNNSFGDSHVQGIKVTCTSSRFEIGAHNSATVSNASVVKIGNSETIYYGYKNHNVACHFGNHIARAKLATLKPQEKGQCGAYPGSLANLWLDGKIVIHGFFNNDCYESLSIASFEDKKGIGIVFKICGHTGDNPEYKDDCFLFQNEDFKSLSRPLPDFPISEFRKKWTPQKKE
ncbi:MAG: hypothetical protein CVU55_07250 [Deltaproteobacteria bacterium HGW-Deltaproteobacteria-13]|jgi:hypothetical protein|nr:MAG: hypothetical protein CVU55_07250 [Deltaproteobacteria bacterium HGW-Deltaproteobacteria-13]